MYQQAATKPAKTRSATQQAPVKGWNGRDSLDAMEEGYAVRLCNIFPETNYVSLRKGFRVHATGMGTGAVQTLAELVTEAGTRKLVACANGNIYDASTYNAAATSLDSGFTSNKWQTANFRNKLILVNGADQPQQYDGSAVSDAAYTGIADDANLISVEVYKSRLYFVQKDTASVWYGGVDAITGGLTEFDVGSLLRLGGYVMYAGSWSNDSGAGMQDLFVIVSSMGETLIYNGTYPGEDGTTAGAEAWQLVGRYFLPVPLGRRAFMNLAGDLVILTDQGAVSLAAVFAQGKDEIYRMVTDLIADPYQDGARAYAANFGWCGLSYPRGHMAIINVPTVADGNADQWVMNTLSGAWTKFQNIKASSWTTYSDKPYFGGMDGKVYEFDIGADDGGDVIDFEIKTAFNYFGDRRSEKRFLMARPLFIGDTAMRFLMNVDCDFEDRTITDTITTTGVSGAEWDVADWDSSSWDGGATYRADWYDLSGHGRCAALRIKGSSTNALFNLSAINVTFEIGGLM